MCARASAGGWQHRDGWNSVSALSTCMVRGTNSTPGRGYPEGYMGLWTHQGGKEPAWGEVGEQQRLPGGGAA